MFCDDTAGSAGGAVVYISRLHYDMNAVLLLYPIILSPSMYLDLLYMTITHTSLL